MEMRELSRLKVEESEYTAPPLPEKPPRAVEGLGPPKKNGPPGRRARLIGPWARSSG